MAVGAGAVALAVSGVHLHPLVTAAALGAGIVSGAFLLSWAAEVAQIDVSASLAIAVLALVAILPEYSIEAVLAWKAGASFDPSTVSNILALRYTGAVTEEMSRVAANVTGANRLLIGVGWSLVILIYYLRRRQPLDMRGGMSLEIKTLTVATLLSFLVFAMSQVHIVLAAVMIAVYLFYLWASSTQESEEPDLVGVSLLIGSLPDKRRRTVLAALFVYAAAVIIAVAEPFVESLIETGLEMGGRGGRDAEAERCSGLCRGGPSQRFP
jgi:cation:H+ antiporter